MGEVKTATKPHIRDRILIHVRENGRASAAILKSILRHIGDAHEGDRGLDAMMAEVVGLVPQDYWRDLDVFGGAQYAPRGRLGTAWVAPALTTSIDAAVEMVGRALPGWSWEVRRSGFGTPAQAILHNPMRQPAPGYDTRVDHPAGVPALALCAALLSALIAQAEQGASHGE